MTDSPNPRSARSVQSVRSVRSSPEPQRLRPSGGFRDLRAFQVSTIVYDATFDFCARFLDPRSRTVDQMTQAARNGRQNIAPGQLHRPSTSSRAAATSSQTELRLTSAARASLDELLLDYEDFLRQRKIRQWEKDGPEAQAVRALGARNKSDQSTPSNPSDYSVWLQSTAPGIVANALICLIHQANYLLDHQIRALEQAFIHDGGYTEQLTTARIAERQRKITSDQSAPPDPSDKSARSATSGTIPGAPSCPKCGKPMALRTARKGTRPGSQFWGCSQYPSCKGLRKLE